MRPSIAKLRTLVADRRSAVAASQAVPAVLVTDDPDNAPAGVVIVLPPRASEPADD